MKFITSNNLKKYIDNNLNEVDIIAYYMDIPVMDIYACINDHRLRVNNTLRTDADPSYGFQYIHEHGRYKLYGKDFANPFYSGDKYHIAGISLKLNCNNPREFVEICKDIIKVFNNGVSTPVVSKEVKKDSAYKPSNIFKIDVEKRDFTYYDYLYWQSMGIRKETLISEKIYAVDSYILHQFDKDDFSPDYVYNPNDPAYAYYIGKDKYTLWEIYRPFANKYNKFRTNNNRDLKELYELTKKDNLIITKSKKDKALIRQILSDFNITNVDVKYTSEAARLRMPTRNLIKTYYRWIYINFDLDKTGIDGMKYFNGEYGYNMFPFVLEDMLKFKNIPKDPTDFCKKFGYDATKKVFKILYNKYINYEK